MADLPMILDTKETLCTILENIDTVISDCDGVIWLEKKPIEGATQFFKKIRLMGKRIVFATNNNTKSRDTLLTKLNSLGFEATIDEVMVPTFGVTIALKAANSEGKIFCLGTPVLRAEIEAAGFHVVPSSTSDSDYRDAELIHNDHIDYDDIEIDPEVSAVVLGMDYHLSTIKMIKACTYVSRVSPDLLFCTNADYTFPGPNDMVIPGTGAYVDLVERVTNKKLKSLGKPETSFFDCIKEIHPTLNPDRTLMIGDRCDTDIAFGHNNKIKYTLLVGTGVNQLGDVANFAAEGQTHLIPTHFTSRIGNLTDLLR